jgi:His-Xaa-Ser system protein HxsD
LAAISSINESAKGPKWNVLKQFAVILGIMAKIELLEGGKKAVVPVNGKVFALEVIYSAAYVLLDKAYFLLDGDPATEIKVTIVAKGKNKAKEIALDFNNELINYSVYVVQAARNQAVREAIISRALATNLGEEEEYCKECDESETLEKKAEEIRMKDDDLYIKDPEGIGEPWTPEKAEGLKKPEEFTEKKGKK